MITNTQKRIYSWNRGARVRGQQIRKAREKTNDFKKQANSRMDLGTSQTNFRFVETERGIKLLAKAFSDQAQLNQVTDKRLSSLILHTFSQNRHITQRLALLDRRVSNDEKREFERLWDTQRLIIEFEFCVPNLCR